MPEWAMCMQPCFCISEIICVGTITICYDKLSDRDILELCNDFLAMDMRGLATCRALSKRWMAFLIIATSGTIRLCVLSFHLRLSFSHELAV